MNRLQQLLGQQMGMGGAGRPAADVPTQDTAENILISSLALLKVGPEWR